LPAPDMSGAGNCDRMWDIQVELMRQDQKSKQTELTLTNVKGTPVQLKASFSSLKKGVKDLPLPQKETRITSPDRPDMYILNFDSKVSSSKFGDAWHQAKPKNPDGTSMYLHKAQSKQPREWSKPLYKAVSAVKKFVHENKAELGDMGVFIVWSSAQVRAFKKKAGKQDKKGERGESELAASMNKGDYSISFEARFAGARAFL